MYNLIFMEFPVGGLPTYFRMVEHTFSIYCVMYMGGNYRVPIERRLTLTQFFVLW